MSRSIPEERVVRHWLAMELEKDDNSIAADPESMPYTEAIDALLTRKPGAASFIWSDQPVDWFRLELDLERFRSLRTIRCPEGLLWRKLSPDGTIIGVARRLTEEGLAETQSKTDIDLDLIRQYRKQIDSNRAIAPLVLRTKRGKTPWYVADGNHRATALAIHFIETGQYTPQPAYIGVISNPILAPLKDRLLGAVDRLGGERISSQR